MPATPTARPARTVRVLPEATVPRALTTVQIAVGRKVTTYFVRHLGGDRYRVCKERAAGGEAYLVDMHDPGFEHCSCPAENWRRCCRHIQALLALKRAGKL